MDSTKKENAGPVAKLSAKAANAKRKSRASMRFNQIDFSSLASDQTGEGENTNDPGGDPSQQGQDEEDKEETHKTITAIVKENREVELTNVHKTENYEKEEEKTTPNQEVINDSVPLSITEELISIEVSREEPSPNHPTSSENDAPLELEHITQNEEEAEKKLPIEGELVQKEKIMQSHQTSQSQSQLPPPPPPPDTHENIKKYNNTNLDGGDTHVNQEERAINNSVSYEWWDRQIGVLDINTDMKIPGEVLELCGINVEDLDDKYMMASNGGVSHTIGLSIQLQRLYMLVCAVGDAVIKPSLSKSPKQGKEEKEEGVRLEKINRVLQILQEELTEQRKNTKELLEMPLQVYSAVSDLEKLFNRVVKKGPVDSIKELHQDYKESITSYQKRTEELYALHLKSKDETIEILKKENLLLEERYDTCNKTLKQYSNILRATVDGSIESQPLLNIYHPNGSRDNEDYSENHRKINGRDTDILSTTKKDFQDHNDADLETMSIQGRQSTYNTNVSSLQLSAPTSNLNSVGAGLQTMVEDPDLIARYQSYQRNGMQKRVQHLQAVKNMIAGKGNSNTRTTNRK